MYRPTRRSFDSVPETYNFPNDVLLSDGPRATVDHISYSIFPCLHASNELIVPSFITFRRAV